MGIRLVVIKNIVSFWLKIFSTTTNSLNPDKMQLLNFICVFTVCKSPFIGFPKYKRVSHKVYTTWLIIAKHVADYLISDAAELHPDMSAIRCEDRSIFHCLSHHRDC